MTSVGRVDGVHLPQVFHEASCFFLKEACRWWRCVGFGATFLLLIQILYVNSHSKANMQLESDLWGGGIESDASTEPLRETSRLMHEQHERVQATKVRMEQVAAWHAEDDGKKAIPSASPLQQVLIEGSAHSMRTYLGHLVEIPLLTVEKWYLHSLSKPYLLGKPFRSEDFIQEYKKPQFIPSYREVMAEAGISTFRLDWSDAQLMEQILGHNREPLLAVFFNAKVGRTGSVVTDWAFVPMHPDLHIWKLKGLDVIGAIKHNIHFSNRYYTMPSTKPIEVAELVIASHEHGGMFWHWMISEYCRVLNVLPFLLANPQIYLHVNQKTSKVIESLEMLGIPNERILSGRVNTNIAYVTQQVDRNEVPSTPSLLMAREQIHNVLQIPRGQRKSILCRRHNETIRSIEPSKINILLIVRDDPTRGRMILNMKQLEEELKMLSDSWLKGGFDIQVIRHHSSMPVKQTFHLYANADIVIGPHGAGFANLIAARTCAHVIEYMQSRHLNILISGRLGLYYHGCLANETKQGLSASANPRALNFIVNVPETMGIVRNIIQTLQTPQS